MKSLFPAVSLLALLVANPVLAAGEHDSHHPAGSSAASVKAAASEGTVKKVDKAAGKITIKHGPLANLGMPPMTMAFRVSDPAMLDQVKAGEKVSFTAENVGDALTVTALEALK
ncbi:MAG: copper-binding protein [Candidatus Accumulibacter sp.]|jgi:Cu(I)/Ag(I) efflux system protein CusF|uniref:copper-binding protein n=1 Tax=unclassified Candidatus Accumulibacter TaxID=2619054 RepID=UPI0012C83306|nr:MULTISPECIES: copper-binding protein [unclassified Candidatus Accumulibacter]MBL8366921.1 copper-binding protein [Accumulibacter sp.]MQM35801.1 RND transporter [Candidatus Accumulibacter phosphatis]HRI91969.1 copper-binding protein [Accumulibacter sp.]